MFDNARTGLESSDPCLPLSVLLLPRSICATYYTGDDGILRETLPERLLIAYTVLDDD